MVGHILKCYVSIIFLQCRGDQFRIAFTHLGEIRSIIPSTVNVLALTATAHIVHIQCRTYSQPQLIAPRLIATLSGWVGCEQLMPT